MPVFGKVEWHTTFDLVSGQYEQIKGQGRYAVWSYVAPGLPPITDSAEIFFLVRAPEGEMPLDASMVSDVSAGSTDGAMVLSLWRLLVAGVLV